MVDQHIHDLLREGSDLLQFAETELNRAEEDVVTFLACNNIKRGINYYLQAFVESFRLNPPRHPTPDNLLRMCISIDPSFQNLNFAPLQCSHERGANSYCEEIGHVQECMKLAQETRTMVIEKIQT